MINAWNAFEENFSRYSPVSASISAITLSVVAITSVALYFIRQNSNGAAIPALLAEVANPAAPLLKDHQVVIDPVVEPKQTLDTSNLNSTLCQGKTIHVVCQEYRDQGSGDIVFACKMAKTIKKIAPLARVVLHPFSNYEIAGLKKHLEKFPLLGVELQLEERLEGVELLRGIGPLDLIIHGPAVIKFINDKISRAFPAKNLWNIAEYSVGMAKNIHKVPNLKGCFMDSGLGKGEWGIFCEEEDFESFSHFEDLFLQENLSDPEKPVFFGYAHNAESLKSFIRTCFKVQEKESKDWDICMAGKEVTKEVLLETFANRTLFNFTGEVRIVIRDKALFDSIQASEKVIKDEEANTVYVNYLDGKATASSMKGLQKKSVVRIVLPGYIPNQDMKALIYKSHLGFVLGTGDQSMSESLGQVLMLEVPGHKLDSMKNLYTLAGSYGFKLLEDFLKKARILAGCSGDEEYRDCCVKMLRDRNLHTEAKAFAKVVRTRHNIEETLKRNLTAWELR